MRVLSSAVDVCLAALVAAVVVVAGAAVAGVAPHVELSDSMRPALRAGDVVWLERIAAHEARPGDVVAFDDPQRDATMLHRVERIRRGARRLAFTTRGDANTEREAWTIGAGGEIGRYAGVRVPAAGRAVVALHGVPLAVVALLSVGVLAVLGLHWIWSPRARRRWSQASPRRRTRGRAGRAPT